MQVRDQMQPTNSTAANPRPSGSFLKVEQGTLQARIFEDTGHLELTGSDLAGAALALTITLLPPVAKIEGQTQILSRVVSFQATNSGFDLLQALEPSAHTVATHLSFEAEAVLRYEVTDWRGQRPTETAIEGTCGSTDIRGIDDCSLTKAFSRMAAPDASERWPRRRPRSARHRRLVAPG
jgi:hypothetical protein